MKTEKITALTDTTWLTELVQFIKTNIERDDGLIIFGDNITIEYAVNNIANYINTEKLEECYNDNLTIDEAAKFIGHDLEYKDKYIA